MEERSNYRTRYNSAKAADRMRQLRLERNAKLQAHGWQSDAELINAVLAGLGEQAGHYLLDKCYPCQRCNTPTDVANLFNVKGWLLLQPICIKCATAAAAKL